MARHVGFGLFVAPMKRVDRCEPEIGPTIVREFRGPTQKPLASLVVVALQRRPVGEYLIEHRLPAPVGWTMLAAALGHRTNEVEVGRRLVEATLLDQELRHILV